MTYSERSNFEARYKANQRIWGHGLGDIHQSWPCPFCAAGDFLQFELLGMYAVIVQPHTCHECGRSAKWVISQDETGSVTQIGFVQTGGDPPPAWMGPIGKADDELILLDGGE